MHAYIKIKINKNLNKIYNKTPIIYIYIYTIRGNACVSKAKYIYIFSGYL